MMVQVQLILTVICSSVPQPRFRQPPPTILEPDKKRASHPRAVLAIETFIVNSSLAR